MDETTRNGRSVLAEVLAEYCQYLPAWLGVVVTGRPEPSVLRQFAEFKPRLISADSLQNLNDLRAYVRRWLAIESLGAGETNARVERIVTASEENFLYLRKLREAVDLGLMDLSHPDDLPRGLIGLYERWLRRQFPDSKSYERIRPLLDVLVAATRPVPEEWLGRIFGWSPRSMFAPRFLVRARAAPRPAVSIRRRRRGAMGAVRREPIETAGRGVAVACVCSGISGWVIGL